MNDNVWICYQSKTKFCTFESIDGIIYIIYISNQIKGFVSYNLIENKIITKIKNVHNQNDTIVDIRHYCDKINKIDYILSATLYNCIKLWRFNDWECLLDLKRIHEREAMYSVCFLNENDINYIIASHCARRNDFIKVYDFKGKNIKNINNSNEETIYIDSYYDIKISQNFIIACNKEYIKSYDFKNNKIFNKYNDIDTEADFFYIDVIVYNEGNFTKIIATKRYDNYIRIWDFHKGNLLDKIIINKNKNKTLSGICFWNYNYLFVGCSDKAIYLIDFKEKKIIQKLIGHQSTPFIISKIKHPQYGECLLSGCHTKIILWKDNNLTFELKNIFAENYN